MQKFLLFLLFSTSVFAQTERYFITWSLEKKAEKPELHPLLKALESGDYTFAKIKFKTKDIRLLAKHFSKKEDEIIFILSLKNTCQHKEPEKILELSANGKDIRRYWAFQYQKMLARGKLDSNTFLANQKKYTKQFEKFLKGKKGKYRSVNDTNMWVIDVPESYKKNAGAYESSFSFIHQKQEVATVNLDTVFGEFSEKFMQVDSADCVPVNRFLNFKQLFGATYKRTDFHVPYRPKPRKIFDKTFELQFPKNKTDYDISDIQPILQFLKANKYIIYSAEIAGFASVEGDSVNNLRLQEKRADILVKLLEKNNPDSIEVTLKTQENWDLFYQQIKNTKFADWRNKSREETKKWLENDSVEVLLEPILAPQRKAILKLKVAENLTITQKQEITKEDYQQAVAKLNSAFTSGKDRQLAIRKAASIRQYVKENLRRNNVPKGINCGEILKNTTPELAVIDFYESVADYRKGKEPICQTLSEITKKAFEASVILISNAVEQRNLDLYAAQALDIQLFTFNEMLNKKFPANMLCEISYPDKPRFRDLYLSRLSFESFEGKKIFEEANCPKENKPTGVSRIYYRLLRDLVLTGKDANEFDIYELLYYSVDNWNTKNRTVYDDEVNDKVMLKLMQKLTGGIKRLCPIQYNQLYLDFYSKNTYFQATNPALKQSEKIRQVAVNLGLVKKYFLDRIEKTEEPQLLQLAQLYGFYSGQLQDRSLLNSSKEILDRTFQSKKISFKTVRYYLQISTLFPDKESAAEKILRFSAILNNTEWCSLFSGKGNFSLMDEKLIKKYCESCGGQ